MPLRFRLRRSGGKRDLRRAVAPVRADPMVKLGTDVFHDVLRYLPMADLLVVEQVCSAWYYFCRTNGALWRFIAFREKIETDEVDAIDTWMKGRSRNRNQVTVWRRFCLNTVPMQRAWADGRANFRAAKYPTSTKPLAVDPTVIPELISQVAFVTPGLFVTSSKDRLTLSTFISVVDTVIDVPTYHHLEACAGFVVGMHTSNHIDSVCPKPLPTRVEIWRVATAEEGGRPRLELVSVLEHPPVWGYALRTHRDTVSPTEDRIVVAVLAGETKVSGMHPEDHWTSVRQHRSVHLWHLNIEGELIRHQKINLADVGFAKSLELDDDHIFIPSNTEVHIYQRTGEPLVVLPSPPQDAAIAFRFEPNLALTIPSGTILDPKYPLPCAYVAHAGARRATEPYWDAMGLAHARPASRRKEQYAKCRKTKRDLVVTCPAGALFIIREYREVLARMADLRPEERVESATDHTILIATGQPIDDMATHGDRVGLRMARHREMLVALDATDFPALPSEGYGGPPTCPPRLLGRVLCSRKGRDRPIEHAMYMDATGVYYPAGKSVRAHFFGSLPALRT